MFFPILVLATHVTLLSLTILDKEQLTESNREILVYNICLISISNSVSDGATNKTVLNIERS